MNFFRREYQSLNVIEVNSEALMHNFRLVQNAHPEALVAPVLKSNAYGHGLRLIGKWASEMLRPPFLCVDSLYEAYELQKAGIRTPSLVLGYTFPQNFKTIRRLTAIHLPVFDMETAQILNRHQPGVQVHLKIDTGMHRLGLLPDQINEAIRQLKTLRHLTVVGIYSHLSQADNPNRPNTTKNQVTLFKNVIRQFEAAGFLFKWKHISASAAALPTVAPSTHANPNFINDPEFNLVRCGLALYGYSPFSSDSKTVKVARRLSLQPTFDTSNVKLLQPALTLITHIAQIKEIGKGSQVSYGGTFTSKKRMKIGVLPIGYYDGLNRKLSNKGIVSVEEKKSSSVTRHPSNILGRICMNMCMIDLSNFPKAQVGDEVEVISAIPNAPNSVEAIATLCDTVPYEALLSNLSETTRRVLK
jgi:alanine racemase